MTITLEQIITEKERLQKEVVERKCVLACLSVIQNFLQSRPATTSVELGPLAAVLAPDAPVVPQKAPAEIAPPTPAALPAPPPQKRYIHPELQAISTTPYGRNGSLVSWAIQRMAADYSLHDIAAMLQREGHGLSAPEISVVLSRMKRRGEIEEVKPGAGPYPAVFRKAESALLPEPRSEDTKSDAGMALEPAAVA